MHKYYVGQWARYCREPDGRGRVAPSIVPSKFLSLRHNLMVLCLHLVVLHVSSCYFLDKMEDGLEGIVGIPLAAVIVGTMTNTMRYNRRTKHSPLHVY